MNKYLVIFVLILLVALFLWYSYRHSFKKIVLGAITLITGGVKTGKSNLSVELVRSQYFKRHRRWWIATHIFHKELEEPLLYTNVVYSFGNYKNIANFPDDEKIKRKPHKFDKNIMVVNREILLRMKRVAYGSVVYIQESSLLSDQMDFTDQTRNAVLSVFNKLFGHETKGGILIYDTQSSLDNHYSIKRVVSSFFYIQKKKNFGLFHVLYIREMVNSDSVSSTINNVNEDIDFSVRKYIIWRSNFKHYDRYYFSYLTDDLEVSAEPFVYHASKPYSFNPIYTDIFNGLSYEEVCRRVGERTLMKKQRKEVNKDD